MGSIGGRKKTIGRGGPRLWNPGGNLAGEPADAGNKITLGREVLLEGEIEGFRGEGIALFAGCDLTASCFCLDRFLAICRDDVAFEAFDLCSNLG